MKVLQCFIYGIAAMCALSLGGCLQTHNDVVISQPKPLEVNVNLNGKLTLVIQDARNDMDFIAGGQDRDTTGTSPATAPVKPSPARTEPPSSYLDSTGTQARVIFADTTISKADILQHLRADFAMNHKLLLAHLVGEAHTGYMEARAALTNAQQAFVAHDNRWRKRLYELRAAQTGQPTATIGMIYFKIRLKFVPNGAWVQQYDSAKGRWVWIHWKK